jgi:hypothetical protein
MEYSVRRETDVRYQQADLADRVYAWLRRSSSTLDLTVQCPRGLLTRRYLVNRVINKLWLENGITCRVETATTTTTVTTGAKTVTFFD